MSKYKRMTSRLCVIEEQLLKIRPFVTFSDKRCRQEEMSVIDHVNLIQILEMFKPKKILEIGCWTGSCCCFFGNYVKENGGMVYSIDNFKGSPGSDQDVYVRNAKKIFFSNIKRFGLEKKVALLEGTSDDFASLDMMFDMVFIDADHRYSQVKRDLDNFYPKVKEGGVMVGHDLNIQGNYEEKYIEEDYVNGIHHGVAKAVNEKFKDIRMFSYEDVVESSIWHVVKEPEPALAGV